MTGRSALELLGWEPHEARTLAMRFRRLNIAALEQMVPHWKDQDKLIAAAKQGRQQLEQLFAEERKASRHSKERAGWSRRVGAGEEPAPVAAPAAVND